MGVFWNLLVIICILVPVIYALYYFGFLVTRAGASWFRADISLPIRWEGKTAGTTGFQRRNFAVFRGYSVLAVEVETDSGALEFEVKTPDGSILSPASGVYGRDARVLFDVGQYRHCAVMLNMVQFSGHFRITLQENQTTV